jgi:NhaA family Na+:H+ antiporter
MRVPVQAVLLLFGLANAGVRFSSVGTGTWIVATALIVGKPLGITLGVLAGRLFGLHLPRAVTIQDVIIIGCVAGIGFTVALFFCTASFPDGDLLHQTKMGALFSFMAVLVAAAMARVLRVGRFASYPQWSSGLLSCRDEPSDGRLESLFTFSQRLWPQNSSQSHML